MGTDRGHEPLNDDPLDLLGYVLGALDPDEHVRVARAIERDERLQREVARLAAGLCALPDPVKERPPSGLARRACEQVAEFERTRGSLRRIAAAAGAGSEGFESRGSRWQVQDLAVSAAVCLVLASLLIPAVAYSRNRARILDCQNRLRHVASAFGAYCDLNGGLLPYGERQSPLFDSGAYAPILRDAELIDQTDVLCPSSRLAAQPDFRIPSCDELRSASKSVQERLRGTMGGSFAYTLGHVDEGRWKAPKWPAPPFYVVMSDASDVRTGTRQPHGSCGQNVLFGDGHVGLVTDCKTHCLGDRIFVNREGQIAAGLDPDDSVVAPSGISPLPTWAVRVR